MKSPSDARLFCAVTDAHKRREQLFRGASSRIWTCLAHHVNTASSVDHCSTTKNTCAEPKSPKSGIRRGLVFGGPVRGCASHLCVRACVPMDDRPLGRVALRTPPAPSDTRLIFRSPPHRVRRVQ